MADDREAMTPTDEPEKTSERFWLGVLLVSMASLGVLATAWGLGAGRWLQTWNQAEPQTGEPAALQPDPDTGPEPETPPERETPRQPAQQPAPEPAPQPEPRPVPQPAQQPEPEPQPTPEPKPEPEPRPAPETEPRPDPPRPAPLTETAPPAPTRPVEPRVTPAPNPPAVGVATALAEQALTAPTSRERGEAMQKIRALPLAPRAAALGLVLAGTEPALEYQVRRAAEQATELPDDDAALDLLRQAARHPSPRIRLRALDLIPGVAPPPRATALLGDLLAAEPDPAVQLHVLAVAQNMLRRNAPQYDAVFAAGLRHPSEVVRRQALSGIRKNQLRRLTDEVAAAATGASDVSLRRAALELLRDWGAPEVFEVLRSWVTSHDPVRKSEAVSQLLRHHSQERRTYGLLYSLRNDADPTLRQRVKSYLQQQRRGR